MEVLPEELLLLTGLLGSSLPGSRGCCEGAMEVLPEELLLLTDLLGGSSPGKKLSSSGAGRSCFSKRRGRGGGNLAFAVWPYKVI